LKNIIIILINFGYFNSFDSILVRKYMFNTQLKNWNGNSIPTPYIFKFS
jgi:hypothetical protein